MKIRDYQELSLVKPMRIVELNQIRLDLRQYCLFDSIEVIQIIFMVFKSVKEI